ncbi:hypothetical protein CSC2_40530 [Clostridium zeae]|uniref:Uncharacterized protein n=1 Tax=Clostridium zeae TaxID=2759022 RepID=A0ABQ1EFC8_9CLOT|nr:hypothetical protein [Clostridium zeae]GFZ33527.1 hypothetical protein CSC2_40530 [Clostridium zeae]
MADSSLNFDTPKTGTIYTVQATGTLIPGYVGYLTINVSDINSTSSLGRTLTNYKKTLPLSNTSSINTAYNVTTTLTIVPKTETGDTITVTWGLSQTP